jgi:hypothetical protein
MNVRYFPCHCKNECPVPQESNNQWEESEIVFLRTSHGTTVSMEVLFSMDLREDKDRRGNCPIHRFK